MKRKQVTQSSFFPLNVTRRNSKLDKNEAKQVMY